MIPQLKDLSLGKRIVLTFVIVIVLLFILAAIGYFSGGWDDQAKAAVPSKQVALCSDEKGINEAIDKIAFEALDDALKKQIEHLFTTWMKDDSGQPARAATGVKQAALAYVHARAAILDWNIPPCKQ